ncbi:hypothetical protein PGQ11_010182 [Apiospora arundinis]|uniref:Uncharacterized protein n=1 Tax=Apiospora arundinis TaxID=335852 RepID=A0ABR2I8Z4_9PEZI
MEQNAAKPFSEAKQPGKNLDDDPGSDAMLKTHLQPLVRVPEKDELHEIVSAPLFTKSVLHHAENLSHDLSKAPSYQYARLAGDSNHLQKTPSTTWQRLQVCLSAAAKDQAKGSRGLYTR